MKISKSVLVLIIVSMSFVTAACASIDISAGPSADGKLALSQAGATATVQAAQAISTRTAQENLDKAKLDDGTRDMRTSQGNILAGALAGGLGVLLLFGIPSAGCLGALYLVFVVRRKSRQPSAAKSGPWTIATVPGLEQGGVVLHDDQPGLVTYVGGDVPGKVFTPSDPRIAIEGSRSRAAIEAGRGKLQNVRAALQAMRDFQNLPALVPPGSEESEE